MASKLITKAFPGFGNLYVLDDPMTQGAFFGDLQLKYNADEVAGISLEIEHERDANPTQEINQLIEADTIAEARIFNRFATALFRGDMKVTEPLLVAWGSGRKSPSDLVWGSIPLLFFSKKIASLLDEHSITGWKGYPVSLYDKAGMLIPDYQALGIVGRCGCSNPAKAVRGLKEYPTGLWPVYRGLYFDPANWDGSDIFLTEDKSFIVVTERVKTLFEKNKIRHISFAYSLESQESAGFKIQFPEVAKEINARFVQDWAPELQEYSERMQSQGLPCVLYVYPDDRLSTALLAARDAGKVMIKEISA
ncbi:MAG: hypothetical protein ABL925_16935 [Methylococcales bacterium]